MMYAVRALPSYDEAVLLPAAPRVPVPPEYGDANGHMNVRHHLALYDDAEWSLFDAFDAGTEATAAGEGGMFALEQTLSYRREVLVGDEVAVHLRLLGRTAKLLHLVSYLLNHSRGEVAGSMEALEGYVDHGTRRLAPFPGAAGAKLDALVASHAALPWTPVLSGSIRLARGER
jgi:acyl-CoA thioester hydrolase